MDVRVIIRHLLGFYRSKVKIMMWLLRPATGPNLINPSGLLISRSKPTAASKVKEGIGNLAFIDRWRFHTLILSFSF
jgi:hypothetical protein